MKTGCGDRPVEDNMKPRSLGSHYTPHELAWEHVQAAVDVYGLGFEAAEILDPACGDGALLAAACDLGADPCCRIAGVDLDPVAVREARDRCEDWAIVEGDALFLDSGEEHYDIVLCNPPWIGKVSYVLGTEYAKRVAKRFGPDYNAASDLSAAFVLRASEMANQLSFIVTNTAWQGRTYRSGVQRLLLSGEWAAIWHHDPQARYTGLGVEPGSRVWPGEAKVHYITFHLVRVSCERYAEYEGGHHYGIG